MIKTLKFTALMLAGLFVTGCSNEEPIFNNNEEEEAVVEFSLSIDARQSNEPETRSLASGYHFSDGKSISIVKCYVYNQSKGSSAAPIKTVDISISNLKGRVSIPLPKEDSYDLVFLATSIPQTVNSSKMYYNTTERTLNINYSIISNNDEEIDCFFATAKGISTESSGTYNLELKRPFAQLNIGAKDYTAYDAANAVKSTTVSVSGIYNKMNLMDGEVTGSPASVNFGASLMPSGQTFPMSGSQYIAMNYLLVKERKLVDASLTINHYNTTLASRTLTFKNIAVERNYQTNIAIQSLIE